MTNPFNYRRALSDPLPRRAKAFITSGAGGQHTTPLPSTRKRQVTPKKVITPTAPQPNPVPAPGTCWFCGHLALQSPCRDCVAKDPEPQPVPPQPKIDMGPLPEPKRHTYCYDCGDVGNEICCGEDLEDSLYGVVTEGYCVDCCGCPACAPEPLPAAYANFRPDMSCYVTSPQPETAGEIDCRPLLNLLQQGTEKRGVGYTLLRYSGNLPPAAQDAIATYMERIRSNYHEQPGAVMYIYSAGDIYLTAYLPHRPEGVTLISLWDYGVPAAPAVPARATVPSYVQQIGGVA